MTTDLTARYEGRPMIRVLDAWFLDALGALDENAATSMEQLAPSLAQTFNVTPGPWQQVVTDALDLPSDLATQLQEAWEHAVTDDVAAGRTPNVLAFTYAMVDASFPQED